MDGKSTVPVPQRQRVGELFLRAKGGDLAARARALELVAGGDPVASRWLRRWARQDCPDARSHVLALASTGVDRCTGPLIAGWAGAGHDDAWKMLNALARQVAERVVPRIFGQRNDADIADVAQEVRREFFEKAKSGRLRPPYSSGIRPLIYLMAKSTARKALRKARSQTRVLAVVTPEILRRQSIETRSLAERLWRDYGVELNDPAPSFPFLNDREQQIYFRSLAGQTQVEIAAGCGISRSMVCKILDRAKRKVERAYPNSKRGT